MVMTPKGARAKGGHRDGVGISVQAVTDLPDATPHPLAVQYRDAMAQVRAKGKGAVGKWHRIATFASPNGATAVKRKMLRGDKLIDGKVSDWEIESRRTRDTRGVLNGSQLYVRLKAKK